jgi:hypothetical protein
MTPPGQVHTSVVFAEQAGGHQITFGIAFLPRTQTWVIWLSVFGNDLEALTGWGSKTTAETMLRLYLAACAAGSLRLLNEIEESRRAPHHVAPGSFSADEHQAILRAIATMVH